MRINAFMAIGLLAIMATACGGSNEQDVIEQIVIREPGEAPVVDAAIAPGESGAVDLLAQGQAAFAMCTGCHIAEAGEPSRAGPNLYGVAGREAGSLNDFAYSEALAASGIVWNAENLDIYLANPTAAVPGTIMSSGAVEDEQRRAAIIAYLQSLSG